MYELIKVKSHLLTALFIHRLQTCSWQ